MDRTVCARLQYDGTGFAGWQLQPGARTVQGAVEAVLERLCGRPSRVHAAGRTDAGVHALGMAVSATVPARWTPDALRRALNALLPPDCWVVDVREVRPGFHARKSATSRAYCSTYSGFSMSTNTPVVMADSRSSSERLAALAAGTERCLRSLDRRT